MFNEQNVLLENLNEIKLKKRKYARCEEKMETYTIITKIHSPFTSKELRKLIYIDSLSNILELNGYKVSKKVYTLNEKKEDITNILNKFMIIIDNYMSIEEIENIANEYLFKIQKENKCYIDNNEIHDNDSNKLVDEEGNYTEYLMKKAYYDFEQSKCTNLIVVEDAKENISKIRGISTIYINENDITTDNYNLDEIRYLFSNSNVKEFKEIISNYHTIENVYIKINEMLKINANTSNEVSYYILDKLFKYKKVVKECNPNSLSKYLYELSIISEEYLSKNYNLDILEAIKIILKNGLKLLNIIPKEEF